MDAKKLLLMCEACVFVLFKKKLDSIEFMKHLKNEILSACSTRKSARFANISSFSDLVF